MRAAPLTRASILERMPVARRPSTRVSIAILCTSIALLLIFLWQLRTITVADAFVRGHVITISSQVTGVVTAIDIIEGEHITAAQQIMRIDDTRSRLAAVQAVEQVNAMRDAINRLALQYKLDNSIYSLSTLTAKSNLKQGQYNVAIQRANSQLAKTSLMRLKKLLVNNMVPRSSFDTAVHDYQISRIRQRQSRQGIVQAKAALQDAKLQVVQLKILESQLAAEKSNLVAALAALRTAQYDESLHNLSATTQGVIARLFVHVGDTVDVGQRLYMQYDPTGTRVEADVKEDDLHFFPVGAIVRVTLDQYPGLTFRGTVVSIGAVSTNTYSQLPLQPEEGTFIRIAQRVPVEIKVECQGHGLTPGTLAIVTVKRD